MLSVDNKRKLVGEYFENARKPSSILVRNILCHLREYTYVPHGSGIVYMTIKREACSHTKDCHREGPRFPKAAVVGVPPERVKIDTKAMSRSKTLVKLILLTLNGHSAVDVYQLFIHGIP